AVWCVLVDCLRDQFSDQNLPLVSLAAPRVVSAEAEDVFHVKEGHELLQVEGQRIVAVPSIRAALILCQRLKIGDQQVVGTSKGMGPLHDELEQVRAERQPSGS